MIPLFILAHPPFSNCSKVLNSTLGGLKADRQPPTAHRPARRFWFRTPRVQQDRAYGNRWDLGKLYGDGSKPCTPGEHQNSW